MSENKRLKELQKYLNFTTQSAFAEALGIKQGSLSDIYREKKDVGVSESIKRILSKEYSINLDWLEKGEGEMLVGTEKEEEKAATPLALLEIMEKFDVKEDRLLAIIESQQRTIETLSQTNKKILVQAEDNATCADAAGSEFKK